MLCRLIAHWLSIFLLTSIVWSSFQFTAIFNKRCRNFQHAPFPHKYTFYIISFLLQTNTFSTSTNQHEHCYHPKSIICTRFHSSYCILWVLTSLYWLYSPLYYYTERFQCPKITVLFPYLSFSFSYLLTTSYFSFYLLNFDLFRMS